MVFSHHVIHIAYKISKKLIGIPIQAYHSSGKKVWECELDIYGKARSFTREKTFIPFRYQGQYEDVETGLYYNRFRYYSPESGTYISKDPIGLLSGEPNFYAYVHDSNMWIDSLGLAGNLYDIVNYGNKSPGLFNHHNIMDAWAKHNIPGYVSRQSSQPTIQLTKDLHDAAHRAERQWMKDNFGKVRGNWKNISAKQMQELSETMFDAAKVPKSVRREFYKEFHKYIYTNKNITEAVKDNLAKAIKSCT
ncbi:RHS repeat-associated core domain-containing protein [Tenacibaculum mesophilum]|uniref:RHS repeat-associated core domain-containing protein n=1 Tax=Tenacibaculum mesophilum TaxID=104268 RepID=UPI0024932309|nr:RHS repeat-associated core domain-containing protein [Tenacibaculum mesophilum]